MKSKSNSQRPSGDCHYNFYLFNSFLFYYLMAVRVRHCYYFFFISFTLVSSGQGTAIINILANFPFFLFFAFYWQSYRSFSLFFFSYFQWQSMDSHCNFLCYNVYTDFYETATIGLSLKKKKIAFQWRPTDCYCRSFLKKFILNMQWWYF